MSLTGYNVVNLDDLLEVVTEDRVKSILLSFSCPLNADVEQFLHFKAIEFSKQGLAKTHLVFSSYKGKNIIVGYFTLSPKHIVITKAALKSKGTINRSMRDRLNKFAKYNQDLGGYTIVAPLIGQIGKNFSNNYNELIRGDELLEIAIDKVREVQSILGGRICYLECADNEKLIAFYSSNGFSCFGKRQLEPSETDKYKETQLVQLLRYI